MNITAIHYTLLLLLIVLVVVVIVVVAAEVLILCCPKYYNVLFSTIIRLTCQKEQNMLWRLDINAISNQQTLLIVNRSGKNRSTVNTMELWPFSDNGSRIEASWRQWCLCLCAQICMQTCQVAIVNLAIFLKNKNIVPMSLLPCLSINSIEKLTLNVEWLSFALFDSVEPTLSNLGVCCICVMTYILIHGPWSLPLPLPCVRVCACLYIALPCSNEDRIVLQQADDNISDNDISPEKKAV